MRMNKSGKTYRKLLNRSIPLLACQYWDLGERIELPKVCDNVLHFTPLFVYNRGKGVSVYYGFGDEVQNPEKLAIYFNDNTKRFGELADKYLERSRELLALAEEGKFEDLGLIFRLISEFWPALTISSLLGGELSNLADKSISKRAYELRVATDKILYKVGDLLFDIIESKVSKENTWFLLFDEIASLKMPSEEMIEKRKQHFVYYLGGLYDSLKEVEDKFGIDIEEEMVNKEKIVKGRCASRGKVCGRVKVIFETDQMDKVGEGDILVTSMTTPDFLPAMVRAGAFVTDEGGVTCHAAIVAREFNKPCVIGTGNATRVLKDGDEVEVDADEGIVRVLSGD